MERVAARSAKQPVLPVHTIEPVVGIVAGERIGESVAGTPDRAALKLESFDVIGKLECYRCADGVMALVRILGDHVAFGIDDVSIVAGSARHRVVCGGAGDG